MKRFDPMDRTLRVNKLIEDEVREYFENNRHLNDTHLTKIEVKIKRMLLTERQGKKQKVS